MSTDLNYYLNLITSEFKGKPMFAAIVSAFVRPFVDQQIGLQAMPTLYDLDVAVGVQLDAVGMWIGPTRFVADIPTVPAGSIITRLDDSHYRTLLRATIISDRWDGTTPDAYNFWAELFSGTGLTVQIQDNDDMSMVVTLIGSTDPVLSGLFVAGLLFVKPAGVSVSYVIG